MTKKNILDAPLEDLLSRAHLQFGKISFEPVELPGGSINVLQVSDMQAYLDKLVAKVGGGKQVDLPLWAKVWPTNLIFAMFLEKFPFPEGTRFLEVGAGVGLASLVLAKRGYEVTISDIESDALLFAQASALKNGLEDNVTVRKVDFTKDRLNERYDVIFGCEILFRDTFFEPFEEFLKVHLAESEAAEVIIGSDGRREGRGFFAQVKDIYNMMRKDVPYTDAESGDERTACLYRLRRK